MNSLISSNSGYIEIKLLDESFDKFMDKTIDNSHNFSDTNHDFFATHKKISHSDGLCSFFV